MPYSAGGVLILLSRASSPQGASSRRAYSIAAEGRLRWDADAGPCRLPLDSATHF